MAEGLQSSACVAALQVGNIVPLRHKHPLRTSYPHAESAEEEFVFVIEGTPDAWIDGNLHALKPGDSVAFPAGTGICHTFINNSDAEVRLMVIGEPAKPENRIRYPMNETYEATRPDRWLDWPARPMGPHDGKPNGGQS